MLRERLDQQALPPYDHVRPVQRCRAASSDHLNLALVAPVVAAVVEHLGLLIEQVPGQ